MSVKIYPYENELKHKFGAEKKRLEALINKDVRIEHVDSSAIGVSGKNIIDIAIGVQNLDQLSTVKNILLSNGYFEGSTKKDNRIFLASKLKETDQGDYHIHLCLEESDEFKNFIILRNYLLRHTDIAKDYEQAKFIIAKKSNHDRKTYKKLKAEYVSNLLKQAQLI